MKSIILGDIHVGCRNDSAIFADYHVSFFTDTLFPYMKKHDIKKIIQLGDVFDRRKFVNFSILDKWKYKVFDYMLDNDIEMDIIIGNHDVYFKNSNDVSSPVLLLKQYHNITPYVTPTDVFVGSTVCMYVPWINSTNMESTLKAVKASKATIAFGHFEFNGFEMDRGHKFEGGHLTTKEFKKFDSVYSGHFHHRSDDGHVFYVGTPYQITWVDFDSTKGFHVFDSETLGVTFIENPKKVFIKLVYDESQEDLKVPEDLKDKYIKVIVSNKGDLYTYDQYLSKVFEQNPVDVKIIENFNTVEEADDASLVVEGTYELLEKYVDSITNDALDKKKMKRMLKALYTEALTLEVA